jgi:hypothetical protein
MAKDTNATKAVGLLIEVANADTVYRDLISGGRAKC